jgi:hypothetical protein
MGTAILVYFDKILHCILKKRIFFFAIPFFSLFSNAQSDSFRGVGSQMCPRLLTEMSVKRYAFVRA